LGAYLQGKVVSATPRRSKKSKFSTTFLLDGGDLEGGMVDLAVQPVFLGRRLKNVNFLEEKVQPQRKFWLCTALPLSSQGGAQKRKVAVIVQNLNNSV